MWQFFPCGCTFTFVTSASCWLFNIFTGSMIFFADLNLQQSEGLVPHEPARNPWKSSHSNRSRAVLVLSSLKTYHNIFFECFIALTILDMVFKVNILPIYALLVRAQPFPLRWQRQSDIRYEFFKRSALLNRKDLLFETKPTVCKHKQKQIEPSSNNHKLMVQGSLIKIIKKLNSSHTHGFGWNIA